MLLEEGNELILAETAFKQYLIFNKDSNVLFMLGRVYLKLRKFSLAKCCFRDALKIVGGNTKINGIWYDGICSFKKNITKKAIHYFNKFMKMCKNSKEEAEKSAKDADKKAIKEVGRRSMYYEKFFLKEQDNDIKL